MPKPKKNSDKLFTVEMANARLPLVSVIVRDVVELARELVERQQRIEHLTSGREMEAGDPYEDELNDIRRALDADKRRLRGYVSELEQLGVELASATEGVVDFPGRLDSQRVNWCWKFGEPEVAHWRLPGDPFAQRQPLATVSLAAGERRSSTATPERPDGLALRDLQ